SHLSFVDSRSETRHPVLVIFHHHQKLFYSIVGIFL
ncbi:unnamed protein product, partial [Allacma fusca]